MVYPHGLNKDATEDELSISFRPSPDYAAMAEAAAGKEWMKGVRVQTVEELGRALEEARERVGKQGRGMVVECLM
jgi:thiamine pyrophosphate-dependent acetolactate synthase large subunit-like protein